MSEILIWSARSKTRPHHMEKGERVVIAMKKIQGRHHKKITLKRQFYNYPDWEDVSEVSFSINRIVLEKLKNELIELEESF
jgi:hypothetical protein